MYTYKIQLGTNWVSCYPVSDATFQRKIVENEIFERLTFDGQLTFISNDFNAIWAQKNSGKTELPIRVYAKGVLQFEGLLNIREFYDYNNNLCKLKVAANDVYKPIFDNKKNDYNVYNAAQATEIEYSPNNWTYTNVISFENVVKNLVNQIYAGTGITLTYNFDYFKSVPALANLYFAHVRDVVQGTNPADKWELSFETLDFFLKNKFSIYWRIVNNEFQFVWLPDITFAEADYTLLPFHDLTNLYNINFAKNKDKINYLQIEKFKRIKREVTAGNVDFIGADIVFPNIAETQPKEVSLLNIHTDIDYAMDIPADFPTNTNKQFFLLSCENTSVKQTVDGAVNSNFNEYSFLDGALGLESYASGLNYFAEINIFNFAYNKGNVIDYEFDYIGDSGKELTFQFVTDTNTILYSDSVSTSTRKEFSFVIPADTTTLKMRIELIHGESGIFNFFNQKITKGAFQIRAGNSILGTDINIPNVELSLSYTDRDYLCDLSDSVAIINNVETTLPDYRLMKTYEQTTIQIPINYVATDLDFSKLVKTGLGLHQINSISTPAKPAFSEIILQK